MSDIRTIDIDALDDIFRMREGFVLDFSDRTIASFFEEELKIDFFGPRFAANGTSKAKRLRCFLRLVENQVAAQTISALWDYRETSRARKNEPEKLPTAAKDIASILLRLGARTPSEATKEISAQASSELLKNLMSVAELKPQARGFAFEKFLVSLFASYGLSPREPFRNRGEQIDGSFEFEGQTYLVEAKWEGRLIGAGELHAFHGKIEQKAGWTRGLFISNSGFSEDGLVSFGKGKRLVCMNGLDLYEMLTKSISFTEVLSRKVRRMSEAGKVFIPIRELFPDAKG